MMLPAIAGGIRLDAAEGLEQEGRLGIDARFVVTLDPVHETALLAGVPLTFVVEFTLTKPRWYWAWRKVADWFNPTARTEYKLSYHALTRSYRVSAGTLYRSYDTLGEAVRNLGVVRDWAVAERGSITKKLDSRFAGDLLMRLDTSQLPRPLQLSLIGDSEWKLESESTQVEFTEGAK
ncbi:DUF4390 domain-containing protein [Chitinimonas naiadis]